MIKTIVKKEVKKVSVNFKQNVLAYLAELIANSTKLDGVEIEDIENLPTEARIVKTSREPVITFKVSDVLVKLSVSVPKSEVDGELIAVATLNEDSEETEEVEETEAVEDTADEEETGGEEETDSEE